MKIYEIVIIIMKNYKFINDFISSFKYMIINNDLILLNIEKWGILKLCYKIKNQNKGYFVLFRFKSNPHFLNNLLILLKSNINSFLIRFLIVCLDKNIYYFNFDNIRKVFKNNVFKKKNKKKF